MEEVKRTAAIWARRSTEGQNEASLEDQVEQCRQLLEREGYSPVAILQDTWSSMDLANSPKYQRLYSLVYSHQLEAIAVYDRDRLPAPGKDRMSFLWDLAEYGVKLFTVHGPPIQDSPEGQAIELLLAAGKERQVRRARQGSKDGLHFRVATKRKPVGHHKLFGYRWESEDTFRLIPNEDYATLQLIFKMLLSGSGYQPIIDELRKQGIPSPAGQPTWNKTTLSAIVWNPVYAGRYHGLKKAAVAPNSRRGITTGNSSAKRVPLSEQIYLPEVEVIGAPITWAEHNHIIEQLAQHQRFATRNANRYYLLRGMIFCAKHRGKHGEPRRYHGRPHRDRWVYCCPGGVGDVNLDGPTLEMFWLVALGVKIANLDDELLKGSLEGESDSRASIEHDLADLRRRSDRRVNKAVALEDRLLGGGIEDAVYQRLQSQYENERKWIDDRQNELLAQLAGLARKEEARETVAQLRSRWASNVFSAWDVLQKTDPRDWPQEQLPQVRALFEAVDFKLEMYPLDAVNEPDTLISNLGLGGKPVRYKVSASIELPPPPVSIASIKPGAVEHNERYPLRLVLGEEIGVTG